MEHQKEFILRKDHSAMEFDTRVDTRSLVYYHQSRKYEARLRSIKNKSDLETDEVMHDK